MPIEHTYDADYVASPATAQRRRFAEEKGQARHRIHSFGVAAAGLAAVAIVVATALLATSVSGAPELAAGEPPGELDWKAGVRDDYSLAVMAQARRALGADNQPPIVAVETLPLERTPSAPPAARASATAAAPETTAEQDQENPYAAMPTDDEAPEQRRDGDNPY